MGATPTALRGRTRTLAHKIFVLAHPPHRVDNQASNDRIRYRVTCKSRRCGAVPQKKARLFLFVRALPARSPKRPSGPIACGKQADWPQPEWLALEAAPPELRPPRHSTGRSSGDDRMNETKFVQTKRTRPKQVAARLYASTAPGAGRRPGSKVAQAPSEDAGTVFESAHLGKPRRFLRRCAAFSKVRTKKCATRRTVCAVRVVRAPPVRLAGMVRSRETAKQIPRSCPSVGTPFGQAEPVAPS